MSPARTFKHETNINKQTSDFMHPVFYYFGVMISNILMYNIHRLTSFLSVYGQIRVHFNKYIT